MKDSMRDLVLSTEAINFQHGIDVMDQLEAAFVKLREGGDYTMRGFQNAGLEKIIWNSSKMTIEVNLSRPAYGMDPVECYIVLPTYKSMHSFFGSNAAITNARDGVTAIRAAGDVLNAGVDLKRGQLTGGFTKAVSRIFMSASFINGPLTPRQQAAVFLHECGHGFTFFEFFAETTRTNYTMYALNQAFSQTAEHSVRLKLVTTLEDALNIKIEDPKALANSKTEGEREVVIVTAVADRIRSELASSVYDARATEYLADQYAIRMGAGKDLAEAVAAMDKFVGGLASTPQTRALFTAAVAINFAVTASVAAFITPVAVVIPLGLLFFDPRDDKLQEDPLERTKVIERELIMALRDKTLDGKYVKGILEDIKIVQAQIAQLKPSEILIMKWIGKLAPRSRKARKMEQFMKDMEALSVHTMEATAHKLKQQAGDLNR